MPHRKKRNTSAAAAAAAGKAIAQAVGVGKDGVSALRIPGLKNRYAVPSGSVPHHKYIVHLAPCGSRNSCTCPAHKIQRIRPCKHVLALKQMLKNC